MEKHEIYAAWSKGLAHSPEALRILKTSGLIRGVELRHTHDGQARKIRGSGLAVAYHNPGNTQNLIDPGFRPAFDDPGMLEAIWASECPAVTFHCAYCAEKVIKTDRVQQVEAAGRYITDREELLEMMVRSLLYVKGKINSSGNGKPMAIENLPWHSQNAPIERGNDQPINIGRDHITDVDFMEDLLDSADILLLNDVPHAVITDDARGNGYLESLLRIGKGRTAGLHLNRPGGEKGAYVDMHDVLIDGDFISETIFDYARMVVKANPDIFTTLEMYTDTDDRPDPVGHARIMVEQAELYARKLGLNL